MLDEFKRWMPPRQAAAIRLLAYNPFLTSVTLNGANLEDSHGAVLGEVLSRSSSITALSVERNDLREGGCLAMVEALRGNTTLRELRFNHQRFTVSSRVEEALHDILHGGFNTTLLKLGLVIRGDLERNRIEALSKKLSGIALGLEATLAPFDADGLIEALLDNHVPAGLRSSSAGEGSLCLNNDTKFVRCSPAQKEGIIKALSRPECTIHTIELANVQLADASAQLFADVLRTNKCVKCLNLEGNKIGSAGISALASALAEARHLSELKLDHQVGGLCSAQAEGELARAIDLHPHLVKCSFVCRNIQSRDLVERALMRNRDRVRVQRQSTKKLQLAEEQDAKVAAPAAAGKSHGGKSSSKSGGKKAGAAAHGKENSAPRRPPVKEIVQMV